MRYVLESSSGMALVTATNTQIIEKRDTRVWLVLTLVLPDPATLRLALDAPSESGLVLWGVGSSVTFNQLNPWYDGIWVKRTDPVNTGIAWTEVYWRKV